MATIKDISNKCGVSPATVSKALNGYTDVSKETIELIRRTANEMHYMPNAAARLLKTNISHNIGVLFVDESHCGLTHEYFSRILNSAKEEAESLGYDITFISQFIGGKAVSFLEHCRYHRCDGVLIACVNFESDAVKELVQSDIPVVTIDYTYDDTSCVLSDNEDGAYALTSELINNGHSHIAYIYGEDSPVTDKRLAGYRRAMHDHGIPVNEDYIVQARYHDPEMSKTSTAKLLAMSEPPTAIMYPDDFSSLGGVAEIKAHGLSVPEDVSVTGYDGISLSEVLVPQLTTWRQNTDEIGRRSVQKLVDIIEDRDDVQAETISVSGKLFNGYSISCLGS
jgi:LacI family transcriptional regulator